MKRQIGPSQKVGGKLSPDAILANQLGVTRRQVLRLGGAERFSVMGEEARALMLGKILKK